MSTAYQELCETIAINALNGGALSGMVFRHDDSGQKSVTDRISVKAGEPVPQLDGPRAWRVEVRIEMTTATAEANANIHAEALSRITDLNALTTAATTAGLSAADDLYVIDEEISGDRNDSKNLRKRSITVPFIVKKNS